jgi:predicted MFS family arabinose efflux permease
MLSSLVAPVLFRRGIHYGWLMVLITFLTMLATASAIGMPGILMVPLKNEFGWDTSAISGALALRLLIFGLMGPFGAALMNTYGVRASICTALGMIAVGLALTTRMTHLWELWLYWGVLVGAGTGMTAIVLGATVANRWFTERRGLVMGLLTASAATGQLVSLPIAAWLADTMGWRMAVLAPMVACALACVMMLLCGVDHPGELGLSPYGDRAPPRAVPPRGGAGSVKLAMDTLHDATGRRMFWVLFLSFAICGFTTTGLVQSHFIPLCLDYGMPALAAAGVLAMMGGFDFVGTIVAGWLSDRISSRWLLFWFYGLRGIALALLPFSNFTLYGLGIFAAFYGMDWIATVPPTVKLASQEFGPDRAPLVFGWIFTAHQIGAAIAALGAGMSRDLLASYIPAFLTGATLCALAALGVLLLSRTRRASGATAD